MEYVYSKMYVLSIPALLCLFPLSLSLLESDCFFLELVCLQNRVKEFLKTNCVHTCIVKSNNVPIHVCHILRLNPRFEKRNKGILETGIYY